MHFLVVLDRYFCLRPHFRAIAESRLTGITGGSTVKMSKTWSSAHRYYSISYYAGVVNIAPCRSITLAPTTNHLFRSPATGSLTHLIYVASTQVTPASGTPTHPYIISSTPNSPSPGAAFRRAIIEASSIPTSFAPPLSQGSPSPAFRPRQFLRAPAPVARSTPAATSGSVPQLSFAIGPIPANSHISVFAGINICAATSDIAQPNPIATPNATPHRRVVYVVDSDDEDDDIAALPDYPSASTCFGPTVRRSIHTNPSTPTNAASGRTSSLVVEADEEEYRCSDFEDPEFLAQLDVVLATHSSPTK